MTHDTATHSPTAFPLPRRCPFDPPAEYTELRDDHPVLRVRLPDGTPAWLVTRAADARAVLADPAMSADVTRPGFPAAFPAVRVLASLPTRPFFVRTDPPEHDEQRRLVIPEFTVRRVRAMRPGIQRVVDERIDALLAGARPADLVRELALPVPSLVICRLLGVPYEDHEFFEERARVPLAAGSGPAEIEGAFHDLRAYLDDLVARKEADPADDLISGLVGRHLPAGRMTREDVVSTSMLLLLAGHGTTAQMISLSTVALLEDPDQLAALRADPGLLPGAVEELLRYLSIADRIPARVATRDTEVGGVRVRAGEGVLVSLALADRDPAVFTDPDTLDVGRGDRHHLAFGYGVHQCLGQNLARLELEVVLGTLFERVPGLRLAVPADELPYLPPVGLHGLRELPVTW
jgi:cytochrome P450